MTPNWLQILAYIWLGLSAFSFITVVIDVPRQHVAMPIMKLVWPLTTLYMGLMGLYAYFKLGRNATMMHHSHHTMEHVSHGVSAPTGRPKMHLVQSDDKMNRGHEGQPMHHGNKPFWQSVFVSSTHCGGGCALGDAIGGPLVFGLGLIVAGSSLYADYIVEFILAYLFGIAFQYFGMGFTHHEPLGKGLKNAIKADTWSLLAYEIGMFGWMALVHVFFVHVPDPNNPLYWFMMQVAMIIGFVTSYPANWVLVKLGVKHAM